MLENEYVTLAMPGIEGALNPQPGFKHPLFVVPFNAQDPVPAPESREACTEKSWFVYTQDGPVNVTYEGFPPVVLSTLLLICVGTQTFCVGVGFT
jgi:hypothetical protein